MTVSGATIQYGSGSVPTTLNSTARMPEIIFYLDALQMKFEIVLITSADNESVIFVNWAISFQEVRL